MAARQRYHSVSAVEAAAAAAVPIPSRVSREEAPSLAAVPVAAQAAVFPPFPLLWRREPPGTLLTLKSLLRVEIMPQAQRLLRKGLISLLRAAVAAVRVLPALPVLVGRE
jgi:hypothetical protein